MSKKHQIYASLIILLTVIFSLSVSAQVNKFEGYNIILDAPTTQKSTACSLRYAPGNSNIVISDLNPATPMKVKACNGSGTSLSLNGSTATMKANPGSSKWCFEGEDKMYRISFAGDQYARQIIYDWVATPETPGIYNIKDFGAVGDGVTDDTLAIKSALAFMATRNGGILQFPEGDFVVGNTPGYKGIVLPSGVTIRGISGLHTGVASNNVVQKNASRITLKGQNKAIFQIGECTEKVSIKDIELYAESDRNTYGVEAFGAFNSAQDFDFENVVFNHFYRGIYAIGLPITNLGWQFDYVKVTRCRFIFNRDAGIYCDVRNSDWKIQSSLFINPKKEPGANANSMDFQHVAGVLIEDTYGGGFSNALGGTFLNVLDSGVITVITSQTEAMTKSFVYNEIEHPQAGDYSYPITFINCVFGNPIEFKARRTFVSTGNLYGPDTFKADQWLRVYSTGDRFCYDGGILGCLGATKNDFDRASIIFMTGQPGERNIPGTPTIFGTDVEFNAPVKMPSFNQNQLPAGKPNGSMVYCTNCRRNTQTCQAGGSGAPAMVVGGQWSCL